MKAHQYLEKIALAVKINSLMKLPKEQAIDALKLHYPNHNPHALYGGIKFNGNPNLKVNEYLKTKGIASNPSDFQKHYFEGINKNNTPVNNPAPAVNNQQSMRLGKKLMIGGGLTAAGATAAYGAMG